MRVLGKDKLAAFGRKHADCRAPLSVWLALVEREQWKSPQDIKNSYRSVDFLAGNRAIFNIKGNHYRLMVQVVYVAGSVIVEWIGTHAEYDKRKF